MRGVGHLFVCLRVNVFVWLMQGQGDQDTTSIFLDVPVRLTNSTLEI
jgi:hypothetical protein